MYEKKFPLFFFLDWMLNTELKIGICRKLLHFFNA